jgi:hypothetical protein
MIYAAERNVRATLNGFHYDDLIDPEFLKLLPFVKTLGSRIVTELRYPNQDIGENNSLYLTLKDNNKLTITLVREYYNSHNDTWEKNGRSVDVLYLLRDLSVFSGYDRFLALTFLAQTNFNL